MALNVLLAPYLFYFGLYDICYNTDIKLDYLECTEFQKWAVKWAMKNILIVMYFVHRLPLRWFVSDKTMLKYGSLGMALTTVLIPVVNNIPSLSILLMLLHVICVIIGPFNTLRTFIRGGYRQYQYSTLFQFFNFFNVIGKGVIFHFNQSKNTPANEDYFYIQHLFHGAIAFLNPETPYEFVKVQSRLALIIFGFNVFLDDDFLY